MMKMTGRVTCCCVALLFAVASVSAVQRLDSIEDLRRVYLDQSVPNHGLVLLYWFAHTVDIGNNDVIRLTFDPENDYGSHHFGNFERLLDRLPQGHQYYTVGNLYQETSDQLPDYVLHTRHPYNPENKDRIIFGVRGRTVDQVYITQHWGPTYDQSHTYQITTNLLRQIRVFPMPFADQNLQILSSLYRSNADISSLRNMWGTLVGLGLFLFIVNERRINYQEQSRRLQGRQNNVFNWNTGSAANYTSASQNDDMGILCGLLLFVVVVVCFFLFCAVNLPKV